MHAKIAWRRWRRGGCVATAGLAQGAVPVATTLCAVKNFYVYSDEEAPGRSMGQPLKEFHSIVSHVLSKPDSELDNYEGVRLTILPIST